MSKSIRSALAALLGVASMVAGAASNATAYPLITDQGSGFSVNHITDDKGNGNFWIKSDDIDLRANWEGAFVINQAGDGFSELDGRIEVEQRVGRERQRVVFISDGDAIEALYSINDRSREIDDAAARRIAEMTHLFVLESAIDAERRVAVLFSAGGADAVFAEINKIQGHHSARKYLVALAKTAPLSGSAIARYAKTVARLDADHETRKAISAIFDHQSNLSPEARAVLLKAAEGIEGDHEIRKLMEAAAAGELTRGATATSLDLLRRISGDHETRKGAEVLLANASFSDQAAADLLALIAANIGSDHEKRKIIETAADRVSTNEDVAGAAIEAAGEIGSDNERRRVIETLAEALPERSSRWSALIGVAADISSDNEKRKTLETIAEHMPDTSSLAARYRSAANTIGSDREREKALERLK